MTHVIERSPRISITGGRLMKMRNLIGLALVAAVMPVAGAWGENVTYTVDPGRSTLTISGTFGGNDLQPQEGYAGSLTTSYTGTITATRDLVADTFTITGGTISAENNGSYGPPYSSGDSIIVAGGSYVSPYPAANYGFFTPTPVGETTLPVSSEFDGAVRNFSFLLSSTTITSPSSFDAAQISAAISSGEFAFAFWEFPTAGLNLASTESDFLTPISGNPAFSSAPGSLSHAGATETLMIPINTDITVDMNGSPFVMHLTGIIVAATPEPSAIALITPLILLLYRRNRCVR